VKRAFVIAVGAAALVASLAGCGGSKNGTTTSTSGSAKVTIDGKDQSVNGAIACGPSPTGGGMAITVGNTQSAVVVVLDNGDNPKVHSVALGNIDGVALGVSDQSNMPSMPSVPGMPAPSVDTGSATATKDGKSYKITGNAVGANMANPTAGQVKKPFEISVTCP
jgi:lipoprotein LpqH